MIVSNRQQRRKEAKNKSKAKSLGLVTRAVKTSLNVKNAVAEIEMCKTPATRLELVRNALSKQMGIITESLNKDLKSIYETLKDCDSTWRVFVEKLPDMFDGWRVSENSVREMLAQIYIDWETGDVLKNVELDSIQRLFDSLGWDLQEAMFPKEDADTKLVYMEF